MIRVGFAIDSVNHSWLGGVNYFKNLLEAIVALPGGKIEPVILAGKHTSEDLLNCFPLVRKIHTGMLDAGAPYSRFRKVWFRLTGHDYLFERWLVRNHIDVLSHSGCLGESSGLPTISWIPDFQHLHLTEYFSHEEIMNRNNHFKRLCRYSSCIILSSYVAKKDLLKFFPECKARVEVLQFPSCMLKRTNIESLAALENRYCFSAPYFHLPNQFWKHKNHALVIEALKLLKKRGKNILILSTGNTNDLRQPHYFDELMDYARNSGVLDNFRVLGMVPYADLISVMYHAVGVINPSIFEGWSTTVEESKSTGKKVILTDIPVHREQNPDRGLFFDKNNASELAELMFRTLLNHDKEFDLKSSENALSKIPDRQEAFAKTYETIILNALGVL